MSDLVHRDWGYYRVLHNVGSTVKVKELTVEPGKSLSLQKHNLRNELWFVAEGVACLYSADKDNIPYLKGYYQPHSIIIIPVNEWHQLRNESATPLKIIEIQYGAECIENDIIRKLYI